MPSWLLLLVCLWPAGMIGVLWLFRQPLLALWHEPMLGHPVLIFESDDWGAGPVLPQAQALANLTEVLCRHRDETGRPPVMTLALVLAVPDGEAIRASGVYCRRNLTDPIFEPVRGALNRGRARGIFAFQLHGLEHYWPATLMTAPEAEVRSWRESALPPATESLPSPLQSRWTDARALPSRALPDDRIKAAIDEECHLFETLCDEPARVAVPPTFVWTIPVERAWADQGVEFVVTPGRRFGGRDGGGNPAVEGTTLRNGDQGVGVTYLVRDDYFEPERGHDAAKALAALDRKILTGRPCLLEIHRSNFITGGELASRALRELDKVLDQALARHAGLRFLTTLELGRILRDRPSDWMEYNPAARFACWRARSRDLPRFPKLAKLCGLSMLLSMLGLALQFLTGPR